MRTALLVAAAAAAATIGVGCSGSKEEGSGSSGVSTQEAREAIDAASFDDQRSLGALGPLAFSDSGLAVAAETLRADPKGAQRWAAVYIYANGGDDPAPLRPFLGDADVSVRVLAAAGALSMGDKAGFDSLVDVLTSRDLLAGSRPPAFIWEVAAVNLTVLTADDIGPPPDADPAVRAESQQRWRDWWKTHGDRLTFDPESRTWSEK